MKKLFNHNVKVTNGLCVLLTIPYIDVRIMEDLAHVMAETITITLGWINAWVYHNCSYTCFVSCPQVWIFMYLWINTNGNPIITNRAIVWLSYILTLVHIQDKLPVDSVYHMIFNLWILCASTYNKGNAGKYKYLKNRVKLLMCTPSSVKCTVG